MESSSTIPAPPQENVAPKLPLSPLFTPAQLVVATFIGSPLAAGVLWRMNRAALGLTRLWVPLVAGAAGLAALALATALFPKLTFLPAVAAISLRPGARQAFPTELIARAGRRSWWLALAISTAMFAMLVGVLIGIGAVEEAATPVVKHSDIEQVVLADEALRSDGELLANALATVGYFDGTGPASINLEAVDSAGFHIVVGYADATALSQQQEWADNFSAALAAELRRCVVVRTVTLIGFDFLPLGEHAGATARGCGPLG